MSPRQSFDSDEQWKTEAWAGQKMRQHMVIFIKKTTARDSQQLYQI